MGLVGDHARCIGFGQAAKGLVPVIGLFTVEDIFQGGQVTFGEPGIVLELLGRFFGYFG